MQRDQRALLADAFGFALDAHRDQTRKGREIPYASHLLQVAGLVLEHGGTPEAAAAALLHDTLEDCEGIDAATLRARFGSPVATVVSCCSDLLPGDRPDRKSPWLARKRRYLARIAEADATVHLVVACDKLHNLRSLLTDLANEGPATLERFSASPPQTRAYHEHVRDAVAGSLPAALLRELDTALVALAKWIPESRLEASRP